MNTLNFITRILKIGTLWSTIGLILTVSLQIFARFFLKNAPSWTEEASRFLFIYAIAFAAGLALKNHYYVHLDMFYNKFSSSVKKSLRLAIPIFIFLLFAIMSIYAVQLILLGFKEKSPSLGMNMGIAFLSIFIMSSTICLFAWQQFQKAKTTNKQ